jgi:hypothetical protein
MPSVYRYEFRDDRPLGFRNADKADPQAIGEALTALTVEHGGHLKPDYVLEAASDRRAYLSQFFTWDDTEAAIAWRLQEARALIRSIEVIDVMAPNDARKRAWLSIADTQGRSYRPVQTVQSDARLQALVMAQMISELRSIQHRYRDHQDICSLIEIAVGAAERMAGEAPPLDS